MLVLLIDYLTQCTVQVMKYNFSDKINPSDVHVLGIDTCKFSVDIDIFRTIVNCKKIYISYSTLY